MDSFDIFGTHNYLLLVSYCLCETLTLSLRFGPEIEIAAMPGGEPLSPSMHQRSSDDHGAEASSKRRKHHHHHRRRHHHRSRQGHGSGEDVRDSSPAPQAVAGSFVEPMTVDDEREQVVAGSFVEPMTVDDEREEGEILEEDEDSPEVNGVKFDGFKLGGSSDAESGEINSVGVVGDTNPVCFIGFRLLHTFFRVLISKSESQFFCYSVS